MTTVVNNPAPVTETAGNNSLINAIIVLGFMAIILFLGIMFIRRMGPFQANVSAPQVVIPDKINVNVTPAK